MPLGKTLPKTSLYYSQYSLLAIQPRRVERSMEIKVIKVPSKLVSFFYHNMGVIIMDPVKDWIKHNLMLNPAQIAQQTA